MQVTTISFFRFRGFLARFWAFMYMQLAKRPLRRLPGIGFHKLLGTGSGEGFDPYPNFAVYAILATWPSLDDARRQVETSAIYGLYRRRSVEAWTVYLTPTRARGSWDKATPFEPEARPEASAAGDWVCVLTRASIRLRSLVEFWRTVPPISEVTKARPGLHFKLGMGERPIFWLMTFSLWRDLGPMKAFAYDAGPHRDAMRLARSHSWFREELFARFRVLDTSGTWNGADPLESIDDRPAHPERVPA